MPERPARFLLVGGGALALLGLALWYTLPIASSLPPFFATALLTLLYGSYCRWRGPLRTGKKP